MLLVGVVVALVIGFVEWLMGGFVVGLLDERGFGSSP
jgi:hypothetical protein